MNCPCQPIWIPLLLEWDIWIHVSLTKEVSIERVKPYTNEFQLCIPHWDVAKGSFLLTQQSFKGPAVLCLFVED